MKNIPLGEWKAKYGRIFKVKLEGKEIYFRLLTAGEMEICKKDVKLLGCFLDSLILNNESLSSTGAKYKLSDFVIKTSFPNSDDEMKEKVLHYRYKVKDDFTLGLISKLCSVFVSYTPDDLKSKTFDQLMELIAIAELMTGKQLLSDKKTKGKLNTMRDTSERDAAKFNKPPVDELMEESGNALQAVMAQFGKKVPTLAEVKAKKAPEKPLTDLQRQMKELNKVI